MSGLRTTCLGIALALASFASAQDAVTIVLGDSIPDAPSSAQFRSLGTREKFRFFVRNSADPGNLLGAALEAGLSQRSHDNLGFGQGARGFGGRYGAALADRATFNAFSQFLFPSLLHQDPRYLPRRSGSVRSRVSHAIGSAFVTPTDSGGRAFNASVVVGAIASGALSNAYYPASERGAVFTMRSSALNLGGVVGTRLAREFWPDIKRKVLRRR